MAISDYGKNRKIFRVRKDKTYTNEHANNTKNMRGILGTRLKSIKYGKSYQHRFWLTPVIEAQLILL